MSSPSTALHYTAGHPPTDNSHHPDATKVRLPPSDPTTSSQQPSRSIKLLPQSPETSSAPSLSDLPSLKETLHQSLRQFPDFPSPGIIFEDILPLFSSPKLHTTLIHALELHILSNFSIDNRPDIIVGLEARGFLFAPTLALRLGAGFVPVRKPGRLPGPTQEARFRKEYGEDSFHIQADAIAKGQKVLVVDDILATGESCLSTTLWPATRRYGIQSPMHEHPLHLSS